MDAEFWKEALKLAPALVVVCVLQIVMITMFLRHLTRAAARQDRVLERINNSCHDFQRGATARADKSAERMVAAIERNTDAAGRNTSALQRVEQHLGRLEIKPAS